MELTPGGLRLRAALAAVLVRGAAPELAPVHAWLDSWRGVGAMVVGMERQGYDVLFRQYPQGWRVNFSRRGGDHVDGTGWATEPWVATQQAAWDVLSKAA